MKITLVIIFNHKFNKNIPVLKKMYKDRFSNICFLIPFYEGDDRQVIPVFESSYQFQGYIAQGYQRLKQFECDHYVFIGDDLILNPKINESNILNYLSVDSDDAYIESLTSLKNTKYWVYKRFSDADKAFLGNAVNYRSEIPSLEYAQQKAADYNIGEYKIHRWIKCKPYGIKKVRSNVDRYFNQIVNPININYPLVTGYSDFFVLPSKKLNKFTRISGVFAAMRLFVEIAIPTALMLIMDKEHLKTQESAKMLTPKLWWITDTAIDFEKKCEFKIENMEKFWPDNYLYLHPIKLSKWSKGE